jgi:hypothetical protein
MKKLFLSVAVCSMLFGMASCAKESVEKVTDGTQTITFKTFLGKQTRASETDLASLKAAVPTTPGSNTLDVYAYTATGTTPEKIFNLTWDDGGDVWTYSPSFEQPGHSLRYYSVYPRTVANFATAPAATSTDFGFGGYTIVTDPADQEDLIGASITTPVKDVNLAYNHLLSQVNFAVQGMVDVKIEITGLSIANVMDVGDYAFSTGWSNQSKTTGTYTYSPLAAAKTLLEAGTESGVVYLGNGGGTYTNSNALMLMPQTFTALSGGSDGKFTVTFKLTGKAAGGTGFTEPLAPSTSATVNFSDFDIKEWESGKRYVYVMDFTSYVATGTVNFTVSVSPWTDETTTTIASVQVAKNNQTSIKTAIQLQGEANQADSKLTIFPINVPAAIGTTQTVSIGGDIANLFDEDDEIHIECESYTSAGNIVFALEDTTTYWDKSVSGNIVVLKRTDAVYTPL